MLLHIHQVKTFGTLEAGESEVHVDERVKEWLIHHWDLIDIVDIKPCQGPDPMSYKILVHYQVVVEMEVESVCA